MDENGVADGATNRGTVHIMFMNSDGSVDSTVEINDSTENGPHLNGNDLFGESVENLGDLNGDGVNDLAVGASRDNAGGADRGTIHVMYMNTDGSVKSTVEINSDTTNGPTLRNTDRFGISIAEIGDFDNNCINDLAVGAFRSHMDENGVIDGGAARQVLEVARVKDILAKSLGSPTHLNVAKATINGLLSQRTPDLVAGLRGKKPSEVAPPGLVEAYEKTKAEKKVKVADES